MPEAPVTVEYRNIARAPGYAVGTDGTVWGSRYCPKTGRQEGEWREMNTHRRTYGARYVHVSLRPEPGGKVVTFYVHRLVLEAFFGPCPQGMEVRHLDNDTANNSLENVRWGTHLENIHDKWRHGTMASGTRNPHAKLNDEKVIEVFRLRATGLLHREIADIMGVTPTAIQLLLSGKTWRHLQLVREATSQ